MTEQYRKLHGQQVHVIIDRPLGSKHPRFNNIYPVNYGFIPNTLAGDGMEIDAYVLGVDEPLTQFDGVVVAIIHRRNDNEDKLIVTARDVTFSNAEILAVVAFQESYFDSELLR